MSCYFYLSFRPEPERKGDPTSLFLPLLQKATTPSGSLFPARSEKLLEAQRGLNKTGRHGWFGGRLPNTSDEYRLQSEEEEEEEKSQTTRPTWLCCATTKAVDRRLTPARTRTVRSSCMFLLLHCHRASDFILEVLKPQWE